MDPSQLQKTVWFYVLCFFDKREFESQCQLKQWMLVLKRTPVGREYYELNRVVLGAIRMTKHHQGGLKDIEDKSEGNTFAFPNSPRCPIKTLKNQPLSSQSTFCCLVPTPKVSLKPKLQPSFESNLV